MSLEDALERLDARIAHNNRAFGGGEAPRSLMRAKSAWRLAEILGLPGSKVDDLIQTGRIPKPDSNGRFDLIEVRDTLAAPEVKLTKTCPQCAEDVKSAAKICHYCRYEFPA
jgi:Uncharacterised protein family UPF0547